MGTAHITPGDGGAIPVSRILHSQKRDGVPEALPQSEVLTEKGPSLGP